MAALPARSDYSWADNLIYMEAGAELAALPSVADEAPRRSGLIACALLGAAALALELGGARAFGGRTLDAALLAMLLGLVVGNAGIDPRLWRSGTRWVMRVVLPLGIILLGARLSWADLVGVGLPGLALAIGVISLSGIAPYAFFRLGWIGGRLATLLAVGNGICGGSAIVAVAPAIGAREDDVAVSVSTVALLGLVSMLALPALGTLVGMDPVAFGTWSGLVIQQTPQVIAAGFAYGPEAGEAATVVKLVRISLLAPVVFLVGLTYRMHFDGDRTGRRTSLRSLVPSFAVGLVLLAGVTSLGFFPEITFGLGSGSVLGPRTLAVDTRTLAIGASKLCLILSMAAVGLETRWSALQKTGTAAFAAAACGALVMIAATALALTAPWR